MRALRQLRNKWNGDKGGDRLVLREKKRKFGASRWRRRGSRKEAQNRARKKEQWPLPTWPAHG